MELLLFIESPLIGEINLVLFPLQDSLMPLTTLIHPIKDIIPSILPSLAIEEIFLE